MEKILKDLVEYLEIPEKRNKAILNRREILKCDMTMSVMKNANRDVASYAYYLDEWFRLLEEHKPENYEKTQEIRQQMQQLEKKKIVREFDFILSHKHTLQEQISDYYKTIQVDLRNELIDLTLPGIYVSQGKTSTGLEMGEHIIIPGSGFAIEEEQYPVLIKPEYSTITSAREARHFYNQISFKYLEQLTKDYSYDLESKRLGSVSILTR